MNNEEIMPVVITIKIRQVKGSKSLLHHTIAKLAKRKINVFRNF